jgi:hypothetical protein
MPRTAGLDSPGTLHHVIVRGIERRHIIDNILPAFDPVWRPGWQRRLDKLQSEVRGITKGV